MIVITEAKKLLPESAIIGISASSAAEAQEAIKAGADYLGIGTMFATPTYVQFLEYDCWTILTKLGKLTHRTSLAPRAFKPFSIASPNPAAMSEP